MGRLDDLPVPLELEYPEVWKEKMKWKRIRWKIDAFERDIENKERINNEIQETRKNCERGKIFLWEQKLIWWAIWEHKFNYQHQYKGGC